MEIEKSLKAACGQAKTAMDATFQFCERNFPPDTFPKINTALHGLLSCISNDYNLVNYITQPCYATTFTELCSSDAGHHAVQELIFALTDATKFILLRHEPNDKECGNLMDIDLRLLYNSDPELQEVLKQVRELVRYHESAIKDCSIRVSTMFAASASFSTMALVNQKTQRDDDYKATLARIITVFRQNPFTVNRSWSRQPINQMFPLSVLNHHHYTSVSSSESIHQPCFHGIEKAGIHWVDQEFEDRTKSIETEARRHVHSVARAFLSTIKETITDAKRIQMDDPQWVQSFSAVHETMEMATRSLNGLNDIESEPRRYAVCGKMSAGKSSVLNSMIGEELLPESSRPCTGWPTIIKDDPDCIVPILTVNPLHFQPFIDFLRNWYEWLQQEERPGSEIDHDKSYIAWKALTKDLKLRLKDIQRQDFKIREKSVSQVEIKQTTNDISDVIRLAYALAPTKTRPNPGNQDFPILSCKFKDIGDKLKGNEFVDLPGLGDCNVDDMEIEEIYRIAMQSCHGTIMVIDTRQNTIINSRELASPIKRINQLSKDNPTAVICTGLDMHKGGKDPSNRWKANDTMELSRMIFQSPELAPSRMLFCSPPMYKSARYLLGQIEDADKSGTRPDYEESWEKGGEMCMDEDFSGKFGRRNWDQCSCDELKKTFEESSDSSAIGKIPDLLYETLELGSMHKRYMALIDNVRHDLKLLWKKQQVMLEHSNSNRQSMEAARRRCSNFKQESLDLMVRWGIKGQEFLDKVMLGLEQILSSAEKRAEGILDSAVKRIAKSAKYPSKNSSAFEIADVTMLLEDQATAVKFLFEVDTEVRFQLDKLQDDIVISVRQAAKSAWEERIRALAKFFEDHELNMPDTEALRDKLVSKLEKMSQQDIATSLAELVNNQISPQKQSGMLRKIVKKLHNPFKARFDASQQALDSLTTGKFATRDSESIAAKLTKVSTSQKPSKSLSVAEAEDLHIKGVNSLGYLIRAPVSGNMAECLINTTIWPFLKESKNSIKPVEVKVSMVLDNYMRYVLRGWLLIVSNDSRTSLLGAIDLSTGLAKKIVVESLDNHLATLDEAEKAMDRPMEQTDEGKLILMQTDFTAAYAASDRLHQMLYETLGKVAETVV